MKDTQRPILERILLWAENNNVDIAPDYQSYLALIMALVPYGEIGLSWAHAFCCLSPKYQYADLQYRFQQVARTTRNRVGLGSIVHLARKAGFPY